MLKHEGEGSNKERGVGRATGLSAPPHSRTTANRHYTSPPPFADLTRFGLNSHHGACEQNAIESRNTLHTLRGNSSVENGLHSAHTKGRRIGICSLRMAFQPHPLNPTRVKLSCRCQAVVTSMYSCTATPRAQHVPRSPSGPETLLLCGFRGSISNGGRCNAIHQERVPCE